MTSLGATTTQKASGQGCDPTSPQAHATDAPRLASASSPAPGSSSSLARRGAPLPPHALAEAQRILDAEARRLLADRMDADAIRTATGADDHPLKGGTDEGAATIEREVVPVVSRDGERGVEAA